MRSWAASSKRATPLGSAAPVLSVTLAAKRVVSSSPPSVADPVFSGRQIAKVLGYRVVVIDVRDEPLKLIRELKYPPDLALDARQPAEEAKQKIDALDPDKTYPGPSSLEPTKWSAS